MADVPWSAYLAVDAGPFKTLSALWRHLEADALWQARAEGRRPWVCPSAATLAIRTARSQRSVEDDLRRLREAGWITRAWGRIVDDTTGAEGRRVYGWALADPDGVDTDLRLLEPEGAHTDAPKPAATGTEAGCGVTPQTSEAAPKNPAGSPRNQTDANASKPRKSAGPKPALGVPALSPLTRERPSLWLLTEAGFGAADADGADAGRAPPHRSRLRGDTEAGCGATDLLRRLAEVRLPAPAQRITPADQAARRRAEVLLAVPLEGLGEAEAQAARRERFAEVLSIALEFSQICEADPGQRRWWCGQMLELAGQRRDDGSVGVSRWEHVEHRVAQRRADLRN